MEVGYLTGKAAIERDGILPDTYGPWRFCRCRVQGAGCRVQGAGCRVQGAGCRVQAFFLIRPLALLQGGGPEAGVRGEQDQAQARGHVRRGHAHVRRGSYLLTAEVNPKIRYPKPETLNLKSEPRNPKPEILNPGS